MGETQMTNYSIPSHTRQALDDYINKGYPPGDFLLAVLSNDLFGALGKADIHNRFSLFEIAKYIYNELPYTSWGSPERVAVWIDKHTNRETYEGVLKEANNE
jgi:hypothetical protein